MKYLVLVMSSTQINSDNNDNNDPSIFWNYKKGRKLCQDNVAVLYFRNRHRTHSKTSVVYLHSRIAPLWLWPGGGACSSSTAGMPVNRRRATLGRPSAAPTRTPRAPRVQTRDRTAFSIARNSLYEIRTAAAGRPSSYPSTARSSTARPASCATSRPTSPRNLAVHTSSSAAPSPAVRLVKTQNKKSNDSEGVPKIHSSKALTNYQLDNLIRKANSGTWTESLSFFDSYEEGFLYQFVLVNPIPLTWVPIPKRVRAGSATVPFLLSVATLKCIWNINSK